jgi:hypothetical protein
MSVMNDADRSRAVLDSAWVANPGYTAPNPKKYPWQWLWDSCFHAIAWCLLGDRRAVRELESLFAAQLPSGFLPNMIYHRKRWLAWLMWGAFGHSTITQPPMYGHALRVLHERGFDIRHLLPAATRALRHLFDSRLDEATGLVKVVHPWETGCDDSPRWDAWMPSGYRRKAWNWRKYALLRIMRSHKGEGLSNRKFEVCPASFNALVAFNAFELAALTGDADLIRQAEAIVEALEATWDEENRTWADVAPRTGSVTSAVATQEAFLPLLVVRNQGQVEKAFAHLLDPEAFLRDFGFAGVSIKHPAYRSDGYWRGGCWPQVCYLLHVAAVRQKREEADSIRILTAKGIRASDLSEYWNPETGEQCGAHPQSWAAVLLAL